MTSQALSLSLALLGAVALTACDAPIDTDIQNDPYADGLSAGKADHTGAEQFVERGTIDIDGSKSGLINANKWNMFDLDGFEHADMPVLLRALPQNEDLHTYIIVWEAGPVQEGGLGRFVEWSDNMNGPVDPEVFINVEAGKSYRVGVRGLYKGDKGRFRLHSMCGISDVCGPVPFTE